MSLRGADADAEALRDDDATELERDADRERCG